MIAASLHWILYPTKRKWHAWRHGESASLCGTLTLAHLKEMPATKLTDELPEGAAVCGTCKRIAAGGPVSSWYGFIARHLKRVHCDAPDRDKEAIASLLAETGTPDDPTALELFQQIKELLLTPMRTRTQTGKQIMRLVGLREALEKLPPQSGKLAVVADAMRCFRSIMGTDKIGHFRPDRVIEVMLQVPDPVAYLQHLKTKGFENLGVAFHPNVLKQAKKEPALRGLFSGSGEYWKKTEDQLNIVQD